MCMQIEFHERTFCAFVWRQMPQNSNLIVTFLTESQVL